MSETPATPLTLPDLVRARATARPDQVALAVDGDRTLTLGDWERRSRSVAHELRDRGVRPGDRVAVLADESGWIEYAVGTLAVYLSGATAVGMSTRLPDAEIVQRINECGVAVLLHTAGVTPPRTTGWAAAVADLDTGRTDPLREVEVLPDDLAEILYTSGTTGEPKPVAVPHANLTHGRDSRGELFGGIDSILCAVPVATNAGHSALMVALTTGSTAHVLSRIEPEEIARLVERLGIQQAILPPGAAIGLVAGGMTDRYDLSSLTTLMFGSSSVPAAAVSALSRALPTARIMVGYGSTESAPAFVRRSVVPWNEHNDPDFYRDYGLACLGEPGGGTEVRIVDPEGRPVPAGELGEICLRSEAPGRTYLNRPEEQDRVFRDGWVRMGDIGRLDGQGRLYFFDRATDVIVSRGRKVSSGRIEGVLLWHPEVVEAAVFGVPDDAAGQLVTAAVRLRSPVPAAELAEFVAGVLPPEDRPDRIVAVDDLPRGPIGKVLKRELRARYAADPVPA